jgi:hypothetical protein
MPHPNWLLVQPHRPPNDTVGDASPDPIYVSVGKITSAWEGVESSLALIFSQLIQSPAGAIAVRAFGAVAGSSSRCDMIEAAIEAKIATSRSLSTNSDELSKQIGIVRKLSSLRNIIAHGYVVSEKDGAFLGRLPPFETGPYFLTPAMYNTRKTTAKMGAKIWYSSNTLEEIHKSILELKTSIDQLIAPGGIGPLATMFAKHS